MRYGLVGTGYWADVTHAAALAARPDDTFVGVWGRDAGKAAALASRWGVAAFDTTDALFADVDAVSFAVPPDVQAPLAVAAAEAGCHLLLEKPIALDTEQADRVVAAAAEHEVASVVFLTLRFAPAMRRWLAGLSPDEGWLGARTLWLGANDAEDSPYRDSAWRRRHGALWDLGPHVLSLVLPVLGHVTDLAATSGPRDTVHLAARHASGGSSTHTLSITAPPAAVRMEAEVYGPDGWHLLPPHEEVDPVVALGEALDALDRAATTGLPDPCDATFGRELVALLDEAAAALGRRTGA